MNKVYLLVFSSVVGTQEEVKAMLDGMPMVQNWRYDIPYSFYLVSTATAKQLADEFARRRKNATGKFIISEVTQNYWGMASQETWDFIKNKRPVS